MRVQVEESGAQRWDEGTSGERVWEGYQRYEGPEVGMG